MNETTTILFDDGQSMGSEKIDSCIEEIFKTLKKELPQELQTYEVIEFLLEEAKENLKFKNVIL
ncbi:hypothetical protein [Peptoniphilus genitalis]|uniref:hypothetical protein n=1 Tax=Peptoniphilus genitalis TaxID=3036303 RepID=UPI0024AD0C6A|nr:hypothetical protein [Peptoniphilus sp. Marseille-Q7072]